MINPFSRVASSAAAFLRISSRAGTVAAISRSLASRFSASAMVSAVGATTDAGVELSGQKRIDQAQRSKARRAPAASGDAEGPASSSRLPVGADAERFLRSRYAWAAPANSDASKYGDPSISLEQRRGLIGFPGDRNLGPVQIQQIQPDLRRQKARHFLQHVHVGASIAVENRPAERCACAASRYRVPPRRRGALPVRPWRFRA